MKQNLLNFMKTTFMGISIMLVTVSMANAQKRVSVEPGFNTLVDALQANPGDTLILQRGGDYVNDVEVNIVVPTIIMGEAGPEEESPAVLSLFADPGQASGKYLVTVSADFTIMNVGILGMTLDEQQAAGFIQVLEQDVTIRIDGCVFQNVRYQIRTGANNGLHVIRENNIFFNQGGPLWDNSVGIGTEWSGANHNMEFTNNTYFIGGRVFGNAGSTGGGQYMNHNSYIATWGDQFFPVADKDFVLTNNIFYNAEMRGFVGVRRNAARDTIWPGDFKDWSGNDSMSGNWSVYPHTLDSTTGRNVTVTNNVQMMSDYVLAFDKANNVTPMTFTNPSVWQFADKFGWTIENNWLQEKGMEIDPGISVPEEAYATSFAQRIARMDPNIENVEISWRPGGESPGEWIWPLPFNLKPTNEAVWDLGDDGYPLGDLNWFGEDVVAAWKAGLPNPLIGTNSLRTETYDFKLFNYPDPFSSRTRIKYELPNSSHVMIKIFNIAGAEVATLMNRDQIAGSHELEFNSQNLSAGLYFCKIVAGNYTQVHKMSVVK